MRPAPLPHVPKTGHIAMHLRRLFCVALFGLALLAAPQDAQALSGTNSLVYRDIYPDSSCKIMQYMSRHGASVTLQTPNNSQYYAGGAFYAYSDGTLRTGPSITKEVLETHCGLRNVTNLEQDGADSASQSNDTEIYVRFSAFVPGQGLRDIDFGLYGLRSTEEVHESTLVDPVPVITLSDMAGTFLGPTQITMGWSEPISGVSAAMFDVTNGSVSLGGSAGSNSRYLTVTPDGDGPVSVTLPAGSVTDSSSYPSATSNTVTGTSLGADSVSASIGMSAEMLFDVPETVFFTGSASASNSSGSSAQDLAELMTWSWDFGDGATSAAQNPIHTYTAFGTYTVQLTVCVYETCDSATQAFTLANVPNAMTPTLSGFSGYVDGPQIVTVTFNAGVDPADPLSLDDFSTTNLALSNLSAGSPLPAYDQVQSYTLTATPLADGPVALSLPAGKVANYAEIANAASNTLSGTRDTTAPVIVLDELLRPSLPMLRFIADFKHSTDTALPLAVAPVVSGAVLTNGPTTIAAQEFSMTLVPQRDGEVSITFPAGALVDTAGNASAETRITLGTVDVDEPLPVISGVPSVIADPFDATITFSRTVEGFTADDIQVTGGSVTGFSGSGTTYTATVTPDGSPQVILAIPAEVAQHVAVPGAPGVFSAAATPVSSRFNTAPVADAGPDQVSAGGALVTLDGSGSADADDDALSYLWTGPADITLSDATAVQPSFTAPSLATGDPDRVLSFTLTVNDGTETHSDSVQITLRADVGVTLSGLPDSFSGPGRHELAITFSRPVTGFDASDLQVTGGSVQSLSGSGASYLAVLAASGQGDLSVVLPAAMAVDGDGIPNAASNRLGAANLIVEETRALIAGFMKARTENLLGNQPRLADFLLRGGSGTRASGDVTRGRASFEMSHATSGGSWTRLRYARSSEDDLDSSYALAVFGHHIALRDNLLLGAMLQLDHAGASEGLAEVEGQGWLIGPYAVYRLPDQPLVLSGQLLYGRSGNTVSPLGTYRDRFETERWLATLELTGEITTPDWTFHPFLSARHARDRQQSYVDSLGNPIAAQQLQVSTLELGTEAALELARRDGRQVLSGGVSAIWSETRATGATPERSARLRLELGLGGTLPSGGRYQLGAFAEGLGSGGYQTHGLEASYALDF